MIQIKATVPSISPPAWALWERKLIDTMNQAVHPFLDKYTTEDGEIIWRDEWPETRDGLDDFYESFGTWPLFYVLGGGDHIHTLADKQWDAVTQQMTRLGPVYKEYEIGYDQFHQSESYIYFYYLCMSEPTNEKLIERARRFAGLFMNEDPDALNYDPEQNIIRAAHNGSGGPRWGYIDSDPPRYDWSAGMKRYGLPYDDVPGVDTYDDLKNPELAQRMGEAMNDRMGRGDVANNLLVSGLFANAYLLTGDEKYKDWLLHYVDGWVERANQNDGLLPDNVGLGGEVGEYMDGRWYGGLYGWSWPHGFHNVNYAAIVAAQNAYLMSNDDSYLDLPRRQMDKVIDLGKVAKLSELEMSLAEAAITLTGENADLETFVVPQRHKDDGWFDYQPMQLTHPSAVWNVSQSDEDWARLEQLREKSGYDWQQVTSFRNKGDEGHEAPWLCYINGENPDYPEQILAASYAQVCRRMEQIRQDEEDISQVHIHHWQQLNPVSTEALVQLTLGAPQVVYYGGMLFSRVRYFDVQKQRPGLPENVAALVETLEPERTVLKLVNLSAFEERTLIVQAGGLGEHQFLTATYDVRTSEYPGTVGSYTAPPLETTSETIEVNDRYIEVSLSPATEITLDLKMQRFVNTPSYKTPWMD